MDKDLSMLGTNAVWGSSLTLACPDARQTLDGFYVNIVFYKRSSNTEPYEKQKEEVIPQISIFPFIGLLFSDNSTPKIGFRILS